MRKIIAVCGILVALFALGAFAQGYAEGYEDGKAAAMEVANNADYLSLIGGILITVPTEPMEGIKHMPESYQQGYVMGYKDGGRIASMQPTPAILQVWLVNWLVFFVLGMGLSWLLFVAI